MPSITLNNVDLATTLSNKLNSTALSIHSFDSENDTLQNIYDSMDEGSIKMISEFQSNSWTSVIFKNSYSRSFMLTVNSFVELIQSEFIIIVNIQVLMLLKMIV